MIDILNRILVMLDKIEVKGAANVVELANCIRYVVGVRDGIDNRLNSAESNVSSDDEETSKQEDTVDE